MYNQQEKIAYQPYPGLRPFDDSESSIFFGREGQIEEIVARLDEHHLAAVMGGSGSGKSSLVRAGVIPRLRAYGIHEEGDFWIPVVFTPLDAPIARLAQKLDARLERETDPAAADKRLQRIERMLGEEDGLSEFLERYRDHIRVNEGLESLRERANLLVVVDQFEEIFRPENDGSQQVKDLVDLIVYLSEDRCDHVYVILTLRTEDLHRCAEYIKLPEILNRSAFLTRRLNEDELQEAIESPLGMATQQGERAAIREPGDAIEVEPELRRRIYEDLLRNSGDPDHLPLLQHLLYRLWEQATGHQKRVQPDGLSMADLQAVSARQSVGPDEQPLPTTGKGSGGDRAGASAIDWARCAASVRGVVEWVSGKHACGREVEPGSESAIGRDPAMPERRTLPHQRSLLATCLAAQANRIYAALGRGCREDSPSLEQQVAKIMFQAMAYRDSAGNYTRRWTTRAEIRELANNVTELRALDEKGQRRIVNKVIGVFSSPHPYIRSGEAAGGRNADDDKLDVSHEAFIRKWPRFMRWLKEDQEAIGIYLDILRSYQRCQASSKASSKLVRCAKKHWGGGLSAQQIGITQKYNLHRRGSKWVELHEERSKISPMADVAKQFDQVIAYVDASRRGRLFLMTVYGVTVLVTLGFLFGWSVSDSERGMFKAEAEVFQPFGVAARMERPTDRGGREQNQKYVAALWEGVVALSALNERYRESKMNAAHEGAMSTLVSSGAHSLRFGRSVRLAHSTTNQAVSALLALPVWQLGDAEQARWADVAAYPRMSAREWGSDPCQEVMSRDLNAPGETVFDDGNTARVVLPASGGMPERRLYFNQNWVGSQFRLYSIPDPEGLDCHFAARLGEAPGASLTYVDPQLRFYGVRIINNDPATNSERPNRYKFVGLVWGPWACQPGAACAKRWSARWGASVDWLGDDEVRLAVDEQSDLLRLSPAGRGGDAVFAVGAPLMVATQGPLPGADERCDTERLVALGYDAGDGAQPVSVCRGPLTALVARAGQGAADNTVGGQDGEQFIDIVYYDRGLVDDADEKSKDKAQDIISQPIARIPFKGASITGLSFGPKTNDEGIDGVLWIGTESDAVFQLSWGGEALRNRACEILGSQPADGGAKSSWHSAFFNEISKVEGGIISRNNNYESACAAAHSNSGA